MLTRLTPALRILALALLALPAATRAESRHVEMFSGPPPSASELARMLFPPKTRAIRMHGDEAPRAVGFPIQFAFDSSEILPQSRPYLDEVGQMMKLEAASGRGLAVEGHTDSTGTEPYNQGLSRRRAESVVQYLTRVHGVERARLQPAGKGESEPLADRPSEDALNRRVQFFATR
jgi:outer membrane protein OmpA-like peptidoglycan-associated protein